MSPANEPAGLPVALRPVQSSDEPFLYQAYGDSREPEMALANWDQNQRTAFLLHQFAAQRAHYLRYFPQAEDQLILFDGVPVGRLWIERSASEIRILDFLVLTGARGRGIGTHLLLELQAEAARATKPIRIYVEAASTSLRLFQKLGFVTEDEQGPQLLLAWEPNTIA
jgi:GNAT superfamily N-acetyltransferase